MAKGRRVGFEFVRGLFRGMLVAVDEEHDVDDVDEARRAGCTHASSRAGWDSYRVREHGIARAILLARHPKNKPNQTRDARLSHVPPRVSQTLEIRNGDCQCRMTRTTDNSRDLSRKCTRTPASALVPR